MSTVGTAAPAALERATAADGQVAARRWADCGGMWLTGSADGAPDPGLARVTVVMDEWADALACLSGELGCEVRVDGAGLLGERAAIAGLTRAGRMSAGGQCRLMPAADGWIAVSLARPDDVVAVDAWLSTSTGIEARVPIDDWGRVMDAVAVRPAGELVDRAILLGLPCAALGEVDPAGVPLQLVDDVHAVRRRRVGALRVVDLSSLWAGPLCAQLLQQCGLRVVKVESTQRPDGARQGPRAFYDLLHAGTESVALDFASATGRAQLKRLICGADVVIEASRPRALAALGVSHADARRAGWDGVWLSITGHGRRGQAGDRVGFGDDAAIAGGLAGRDEDGAPVFCADAVADPATGLLAAVATLEVLVAGQAGLVAVSLAGTAAHLAAVVRSGTPVVPIEAVTVRPPRARTASRPAAGMGLDTVRVLATW